MKRKTLGVFSAVFAVLCSAATVQAWHVRGKVVCDANGNGQFDTSDTPLQNITIAVQGVGTRFAAATRTDANGYYNVDLPHVDATYHVFIDPVSSPSAVLLSPLGGVYSFTLTNDRQFFEQANFVFNCTPPPPPGDCGKLTGGGWILTSSGAKANFGVSGGPGGWGHLNYIDHGTGMHVRSTAVTAYEADPSHPDGRIIRYNVVIGNATGTAVVRAVDNGEPGTRDLFYITLSTGYSAGGELGGPRPGGGNIQLHKCPPGKKK